MRQGALNNKIKNIAWGIIFISAFVTFSAQAQSYTVNSLLDGRDKNFGDKICETETGNGVCTLRAALEETNSIKGPDIINLPKGTYNITDLKSGGISLAITDDLELIGAGADSTFIDGNSLSAVLRFYPDTVIDKYTVTVSGVTIQNGKDVDTSTPGTIYGLGGGIDVTGGNIDLTLDAVTVKNNFAYQGGSGIFIGYLGTDSTVHIKNCLVENNGYSTEYDTINSGAGIYYFAGGVSGQVIIENTTVRGNVGKTGAGVSIYTGKATILNSTISDNHALKDITSAYPGDGYGGGLLVTGDEGIVDVINSTISGNTSDGNGGGIALHIASTVNLFSTTITNNKANSNNDGFGEGGGIYASVTSDIRIATVNTVNSIIAGNSDNNTGPDCRVTSDKVISGGYNLIGDNSTCNITVANGDLIGTAAAKIDPLLDLLKDNGGLTQTHALKINGPAIDAGDLNGCSDQFGALLVKDQRGFAGDGPTSRARDAGIGSARCDIGAYEVNPAPIADAGITISVGFGSQVSLDASGSNAFKGISSYSWTQLLGITVTLSDASIAKPTFIAPSELTELTFELTITDTSGAQDTATVKIIVDTNIATQPDVTTPSTNSSSGGCTILNESRFDPLMPILFIFTILYFIRRKEN